MKEFLMRNIGNIVIIGILILIVILIINKLRNDKKQGRSACGCDCGNCNLACKCHNK